MEPKVTIEVDKADVLLTAELKGKEEITYGQLTILLGAIPVDAEISFLEIKHETICRTCTTVKAGIRMVSGILVPAMIVTAIKEADGEEIFSDVKVTIAKHDTV